MGRAAGLVALLLAGCLGAGPQQASEAPIPAEPAPPDSQAPATTTMPRLADLNATVLDGSGAFAHVQPGRWALLRM
jgi:hypothetical protein